MRNKVLLSLIGIVFLFLVLELGARIYRGEFGFRNFLKEKVSLYKSAFPVQFDPELGWVPKASFSSTVNVWKSEVSILKDTTRSNGSQVSLDSIGHTDLVLAVGDSFTFGDGVSDDETWPAILEQKSNNKVINGGVFGYGLDQSFLRMKDLTAIYNPDTIIFSFIPDDVIRSQLSSRNSKPKPYFIIQENNLVLKNDHIIIPEEKDLDPIRKVLGYSFFTHRFMMNFFRHYWLLGLQESKLEHSEGVEVACHIFKEISYLAQTENKEIIILVQYTKTPNKLVYPHLDKILKCVDQNYVKLIDLRSELINLRRNDKRKYNSLFSARHGHMTPEGNSFVADIVNQSMADSTD